MSGAPLRMGILGAARIAPMALVKPARVVNDVELLAVAARDPARARAFAKKHDLPVAHDTYEALLADPLIDAVYNPLPNAWHAPWTMKALAAGKHVLCEKPFTSNAVEAQLVADAAAESGLVVMEAFHWRYHALAQRMHDIVHGGDLGTVREIRTAFCFPLPRFGDIRYDFDLGGGALMDAGCYAVSCLRMLGTGEPEVLSATAKLHRPDVDRAVRAELRFPDGTRGHVLASMWSGTLVRIRAEVVGDRGTMRATNFVIPQLFNRLSTRIDGKRHAERVRGEPSYTAQLRAFAGAVLRGQPTHHPPEEAVRNMAVIDSIYTAAGLPLRPSHLEDST